MAVNDDIVVSNSARDYGLDEDFHDDKPGTVEEKYRGTAADRRDMQVREVFDWSAEWDTC